jgi:hypothetical protein
MTSSDNLSFSPKRIDAAPIRLADGPNVRIAIGVIQRVAALRAYVAYGSARDWMDKLSSAYVVALATRSADALLMRHIKDDLNEHLSISCRGCRSASIGEALIRERLLANGAGYAARDARSYVLAKVRGEKVKRPGPVQLRK